MYFNEERKTTNIDNEFSKSNKEFNFNFGKKTIIIILSIVVLIILLIILILLNKKEYYLVLNGNTDIIIYKDSEYVEEGYTAYDSKGKKYDSEVTVSGVVNSNTIGEYTIEYNFRDIVKTRKVTVINTDTQNTFLVLKGDSKIYLRVNEKYEEPGYIALDSTDKYIEDKVEVKNEVNTSVAGTYKVIYSLTNSSNVKISKIRYVIVMDSNISLTYDNTNYTNQGSNIEVYVDDNYLDYTLLPDGSKTTEHKFTYEVTDNGIYKFVLYSKDKATKESSIEVTNIDREVPVGSCNATIYENKTTIDTNFTDNVSIAGYSYILDSIASEYVTNSKYEIDKSANTVSVSIKDIAGNEVITTCSLKIIEPEPSSSSVYYTGEGTQNYQNHYATTTHGNSTSVTTNNYYIVKTQNDVLNFVKKVQSNKAYQSSSSEFNDKCLSFAYYYGHMLKNGTTSQISGLNAKDGASYKFGSFTKFISDDKQEVIERIYEEINNGVPVILHVNGNVAGTSRHYVTVVGYKKGKNKETIKETDLLIIDTYDGVLERMDVDSSRFMITGYDTGRTTYGYQIYITK